MSKKHEVWTNGLLATVKAAQRALTYLFDGLESDTNNSQCSDEEISFPTGDNVSVAEGAKMFTRHCTELLSKLSSPTNSRVCLPLGAVLKLVQRCLSVTYSDVIAAPSLKELSQILPGLHMQALDILSYLILCCGTNLLPKGRMILDLCFSSLTETEKMEMDTQSEMRAKIYQVLCVWIEMAGVGTHYSAKVKDFHREFARDIGLEQKFVEPCNGTTHTATPSRDSQQKRKGKGKKKGSRRAESYLNSDYANSDKVSAGLKTPQGVAATLGALQVCQLVAERLQYLPMQSLMRCVLDTASTLQRELPPDLSPYADPKCRVSLYCTVFTLSAIPLDHVTNSADTVTHFQLTSRAHSLVLHAGFSDPSIEVQQTCQNLVNSCKVIGVANRPIVRKVLQDDQMEFKDVEELERQMEEIKEENERLKRKLLESEIESQRQSRLASSLKQEVEDMKKAKNSQASYYAPQDRDMVESESEEEEEDKDEEAENALEWNAKDGLEENAVQGIGDADTKEKKEKPKKDDGEFVLPTSQTDSNEKKSSSVHQTGMKKKKRDKKKRKNDDVKIKGGLNTPQEPQANIVWESGKRNLSAADIEDKDNGKRLKREEKEEEQSSDLQTMLMDFVDADPDSD